MPSGLASEVPIELTRPVPRGGEEMRGMGSGDWRVGYVSLGIKGGDVMVGEYRRWEERVGKGVEGSKVVG